MLRKEKGFTLIELMIVVAIIGILAAIAIPNFLRFQAKSRQGECKSNLGGIFTAMESFAGQYDTYTTDVAAVGWAPTGTPRYIYGFGVDNIDPTGGLILTTNAPGGVPVVQLGRNTTLAGDPVHCGCPDSEITDANCPATAGGVSDACYSSLRMFQADGVTDLTIAELDNAGNPVGAVPFPTQVITRNDFRAGCAGNVDRDATIDNWQVTQTREINPGCLTCDDVAN